MTDKYDKARREIHIWSTVAMGVALALELMFGWFPYLGPSVGVWIGSKIGEWALKRMEARESNTADIPVVTGEID